jgi:hypothetical protein
MGPKGRGRKRVVARTAEIGEMWTPTGRPDVHILGVDPGTHRAGTVAVDGKGRLLFRRAVILNWADPNRRLLGLYRAVADALDRSRAAILAVENPSHPRNARTAHLLGRAVGVCVLAASERDLIVLEYRPAQVRRAAEAVRKRWPSSERWSADEVTAAALALLALTEPVEGT